MGVRTFVVVPVAREWALLSLCLFDQVVVGILQSHQMQDSRGGSSDVCRVSCVECHCCGLTDCESLRIDF
jgi:hypothetical protein